jgi:hypothetical protein
MIDTRCIRLVTMVVLTTVCYLSFVENPTAALESSLELQAPTSEKTADQVYKNIQVLKDLPAPELDGVMQFMSASLGVGCTHCHGDSWESDSKTAKLGTRRMILMTRAINKENFSSNPAITCYTCHQGRPRTIPLPPADLAAGQGLTEEVPAPKAAGLPAADEVVDRYFRAIGGKAPIDRMTTRILRGSETITDLGVAPVTSPIEISQASGDRMLIVRSVAGGPSFQGFDGQRAWAKDSRGVRELDAKEVASVKREADFFRYLKLNQTYPQMRVLSKEKIGGREAWVVGATSRDESRERLYFDAETGLLIRKYVTFKTAFGGIPEVTDFEDYRDVNGIRLPFTIKWSRPPYGYVRRFSEIRVNASIDPAKFQAPAK